MLSDIFSDLFVLSHYLLHLISISEIPVGNTTFAYKLVIQLQLLNTYLYVLTQYLQLITSFLSSSCKL